MNISDDIIKKIKDRLGIDIDKFSYDYDIIKVIDEFSSYNKELINDFINGYNFENLSSNNLDKFFHTFGIDRTVGNNDDLYNLDIKYSSKNNTINILKDCTIKYNNEFYKVLKDTIINEDNSILTIQKIFNNTPIKEPLFTNDGLLSFDKKFVKSNDDSNINLENEFSKNMFVISCTKTSNEIESDFEYLEKAKNILQNFGYSNEKKIELELLKDSRIKSISINTLNGNTNITIFPNNLEELDEIIKYNQHVVDFYKNSNIVLIKPNLVEINVSGLFSQLIFYDEYETIKSTIINDFKTSLSLLYSNDDVIIIKSDELINSIKSIIDRLGFTKDIDYNSISINYKYYFRNNYQVPIFGSYIDTNLEVKKSDIITLGTIE